MEGSENWVGSSTCFDIWNPGMPAKICSNSRSCSEDLNNHHIAATSSVQEWVSATYSTSSAVESKVSQLLSLGMASVYGKNTLLKLSRHTMAG